MRLCYDTRGTTCCTGPGTSRSERRELPKKFVHAFKNVRCIQRVCLACLTPRGTFCQVHVCPILPATSLCGADDAFHCLLGHTAGWSGRRRRCLAWLLDRAYKHPKQTKL